MAPNVGRIFGAKENVKEHFCEPKFVAKFWSKEGVKEHFCELKFVTLSAVHQGAPGERDLRCLTSNSAINCVTFCVECCL